MIKKILKRTVCAVLAVITMLSFVSCVNQNDNWYVSKDKDTDHQGASKLIADAQALTDAISDIQYTYAFFIEMNAPNGDYFRLGTENLFAFTSRGSAEAMGYRKNTYTSLKNDTLLENQVSEEHFLDNGYIYTERFGKKYRSPMNDSEFVSYTEYSTISVNKSYLSESNFTDVTVYNLFGSKKEIIFEGPNDYIKNGIIAFTGLDDTEYTYSVDNVRLTVLIGENGSLAEKHLTFTVEYYAASNPSATLTYEGDFAYTVDSTENVTVPARNKSVIYSDIQNIALLSCITLKGYETLFSQSAIDAHYSKYIKVSDSSKEYVFDADAHITTALKDGQLYYGSVDTEYFSKDSKNHNTTGIFQTPSGYSYRYYDHATNTRSDDINHTEAKYSKEQLYELISATLSTEQIFEDEISSVKILSETATDITYKVNFNLTSTKIYAAYLLDAFSDSQNNSNLNNQSLTVDKFNIEITVRKSDGCIIKQLMDFKANIIGVANLSGLITVEGLFTMTVNSTDASLTVLEPSAFENTINTINAK